MNRIINFVLAGVALLFLLSRAISYAAISSAKPHDKCSTKELQRRDCELTIKPYKLELSRLKVTWSDGTWTSIADAPLPEEKYQWDKVDFYRWSGSDKNSRRWILQYHIWDDGKGEAKVQSLHWVVVELKEKQLIVRVDQIVRKREVHATEPATYTYDRMITHSLKKIKGGLQWTVGRNVGTI